MVLGNLDDDDQVDDRGNQAGRPEHDTSAKQTDAACSLAERSDDRRNGPSSTCSRYEGGRDVDGEHVGMTEALSGSDEENRLNGEDVFYGKDGLGEIITVNGGEDLEQVPRKVKVKAGSPEERMFQHRGAPLPRSL